MDSGYDYIIVGAGSAGCVLANRLSANPEMRVLLVESGPADNSILIDMPRGVAKLLSQNSPHTRSYEVERGNGSREMWLKGRGLGGSSAINGMIYMRGHASDYDDWRADGCTGWGSEDVVPVLAAMEDHELGPGEGRGVGGPIKITMQRPSVLADAVLDAAEEAGTPRVADVNATGPAGGFSYQPRNIWRGQRQSAARVFLRPVLSRPNLTVLTDTAVTKLVFEGRRVVGVTLADRAGARTVRARHEIVLAAGAIETPKLLQLSGVGPAARLRGLGIAMVADVPQVGLNLQDHIALTLQFRVTGGSTNREFSGWPLLLNLFRYAALRQGPMSDGAWEATGYIKTRQNLARPNAQVGVALHTFTRTSRGAQVEAEPGLGLSGYLSRPASRGEIHIVSADPAHPPVIDPNYLSDPQDLRESVALIRRIRSIVAQPALKSFMVRETKFGAEPTTDEAIQDLWRTHGRTSFHVSGSCRMGADDQAVVDVSLKVRGVDGLRIADTSIFPTMISGNTNAAAMMVAWRCADMMLASLSGGV